MRQVKSVASTLLGLGRYLPLTQSAGLMLGNICSPNLISLVLSNVDKAVILSGHVNTSINGCIGKGDCGAAGGVALRGVGEEVRGCDGG